MTTVHRDETAAAPTLPEGLRLDQAQRLDTCEREPVFLLSGRNGSRLRLSESALQLLRLREAGVTPEAIAEALGRNGRTITAEEVERRYRKLLGHVETLEANPTIRPMGFLIRFRLLPEAVVARIADRLRHAFRPAGVQAGLVLLALAGVALAASGPTLSVTPASFWTGYALLLVSVLAHELGHASACAYYGVRPSDIGATLYLIYPALYSNVSAAWQLPRGQRVVVDVGGMYFQFLVAGLYAACYAVTGWSAFLMAILMIGGSTVFSMNPVFKFDGYWLVADSLGVVNLSRQPAVVLGHYWKRLRGRPTEPLPWSPRIVAVLVVYSVLSFTIWTWFLSRIGPRVVHMVADVPPLVSDFLRGTGDTTLGSLLMSLAMAVLSVYIAWRLGRSMIVRPLWTGFQRLQEQRAAARAAALEES